MGKPDYDALGVTSLVALASVSEIVPGLWQGMRPKSYDGYALVVSCEEFLAKGPMSGFSGGVLSVPMRDDDSFCVPGLLVEAAARAIVRVLADEGKVLVHCTGGLNRSSVVTAMALRQLGYSRRAAVDQIRAKRDSFCLCNRAFERWVLGESLPTAETSAFRDTSATTPALQRASPGLSNPASCSAGKPTKKGRP